MAKKWYDSEESLKEYFSQAEPAGGSKLSTKGELRWLISGRCVNWILVAISWIYSLLKKHNE